MITLTLQMGTLTYTESLFDRALVYIERLNPTFSENPAAFLNI